MSENERKEALAMLFAVKRKLEDSKDKKEQHALQYINEGIKWLQYDGK